MSESSDKNSSDPKEPQPMPLNKLQVDALVAAVTKNLLESDLFNSLRVEMKQETTAQRQAREKKEGKRVIGDTSHVRDYAETSDEEQELLHGIAERSAPRPANRRAPIRDEDIMLGHYTPRRGGPRAAAATAEESLGNVKLRIPSFEGKNDPDAYLEWERKMEHVFDLQHFSEPKKVRLAATEFSGYALHWWDQLILTRRRTGVPQVASWFELKTLMKQRFVPVHYHKEVHNKLRRLTQGFKSVDDYFQEMETLMIRADVNEDEEATMARFLAGLNREIQDQLEMYDFSDVYELLHKANLIEKRLKRRSTTRNFSNNSRPPRTETAGVKLREEPKGNLREDKGKTGAARSRDIKCFKCQGFGHYANECTSKKVMLVLDSGEIVSEEEETEISDEETIDYPVHGKLMVTRRSLAVQTTPSEIEQRETLFHTRCLVSDKVCSLIIDSGSCTNVASESFVGKSGLPTTKHPKPYKLQWLNEEGELKVSEQVTVPFSIGRYSDTVLFDVLPMDSSHLLLGRPWQFDKRTAHDGYTNRYSFNHNNKKIVLAPLSPQEVYADQLHLKRQKSDSESAKVTATSTGKKEVL